MHAQLRKEQLAFMDKQARLDNIIFHRVQNLVERQNTASKFGSKSFKVR